MSLQEPPSSGGGGHKKEVHRVSTVRWGLVALWPCVPHTNRVWKEGRLEWNGLGHKLASPAENVEWGQVNVGVGQLLKSIPCTFNPPLEQTTRLFTAVPELHSLVSRDVRSA